MSGISDAAKAPHSITSSASNCIELGTSMPSVLAVCRLITNSNLVDCTTGKSVGFSPFQNPPYIDAHQAIHVRKAVAIRHQTARVSEVT